MTTLMIFSFRGKPVAKDGARRDASVKAAPGDEKIRGAAHGNGVCD